ncbi:MAG: hypothetical protein M3198_06205, partial [Actinomycetota bacterium]|nr:hypothetical protein [Actinomycetota bacterium]
MMHGHDPGIDAGEHRAHAFIEAEDLHLDAEAGDGWEQVTQVADRPATCVRRDVDDLHAKRRSFNELPLAGDAVSPLGGDDVVG